MTTTFEAFKSALWDELAPFEQRIEETEEIPKDEVFPILRRLGAFGLFIPSECGGAGLSVGGYIPYIAEIAKVHGGIRALVHVHNSMGHAYLQYATPEDRARLGPLIAAGEASVAFALTEPDGGTGNDSKTQATITKDGYRLNGRKWLITNSDFATHFLVFAMLHGAGLTCFVVEPGTPGFTIAPMPELMGCKGGQHGLLEFNDVRVSASSILGNPGEALSQMEEILEVSRVLVAASSLGVSERALELALEHSETRVTFGKPIASRQAVQRYIAEMASSVYSLRLVVEDAARALDHGGRAPGQASAAKLNGLETVGKVTDLALLVHGGVGYTRAHSLERLYRDARLNWLEEGTPTIQYHVLAHQSRLGPWWRSVET